MIGPVPPRPRHEVFTPAAAPARPRIVTVSVGLWLAAAVVQVAAVALTLLDLDLPAEVTRVFPEESQATRERVAAALLGILVGSGAVIMLLQLGFARALGMRKRWARVALVPVGVLAALYGVAVLGALVSPVVCLLVGAVAAMFLPASSAWFGWGRGK